MRDLEEIWAEAFRERYNEGPKRVTMLFGEKVREECEREMEERMRSDKIIIRVLAVRVGELETKVEELQWGT